MVLSVLLFFAGLLLLYYGAEYLVSGSSRLALSFGIPPLIIGMTIVAFATSMPELMVSLLASLKGSSDIAAGNIVGSNVANIGLILGVAALLSPLAVARSTVSREIPFMIFGTLVLYFFCLDGALGFLNGLVLFGLLVLFLFYCLHSARASRMEQSVSEEEVEAEKASRNKDLFLILLGIVGLGVGAELMVRSAVTIAKSLGVSELVIGISIVALGTSLPELAASMMSAWKGEMDLSIGNVIGSNIFNILFVLGLCPMIRPLPVDPSLLRVEFPFMILLSIGLLFLARHRMSLGRAKGGFLLAVYCLFVGRLLF